MRARVAAYVCVGMVLLCLWAILVYRPLDREHGQVLQQVADVEAQLTDINRTLARLPEFLAVSSQLEESRLHLQSSLYAKRDILKLLERITDQAEEHGLTLTEIIPPVNELLELNRIVAQPDEPQFLNLVLRLNGSYRGFGRFVGGLESAPYFRGINSCQIVSSRDVNRKVTFSVGFRALLGNVEATT
ncbi:MAG TPA: hypothetical protein VMY05_04150 [Acidobacteriota bacterium]|nr:hypothetical protein [Acidobacteriota bacterium]